MCSTFSLWVDVVDDSLGERPFDPEDVLRERHPREFEREAIGYLTAPVDILEWITRVRERFTFLRDLDDEEQLISRCSKAEEWLVRLEDSYGRLGDGGPEQAERGGLRRSR
jgi:hypothetical protein